MQDFAPINIRAVDICWNGMALCLSQCLTTYRLNMTPNWCILLGYMILGTYLLTFGTSICMCMYTYNGGAEKFSAAQEKVSLTPFYVWSFSQILEHGLRTFLIVCMCAYIYIHTYLHMIISLCLHTHTCVCRLCFKIKTIQQVKVNEKCSDN